MELLLTVSLLAVIAAMTMPAFYTSAGDKLTQSRIAMFKARYLEIRSAIDLQMNDSRVLHPDYHVEPAPGAISRLRKLIESGYLQAGATIFENNRGAEEEFTLESVLGSPVEAQLPPILRKTELHVFVKSLNYDIDHALKIDGKSWSDLWKEINP